MTPILEAKGIQKRFNGTAALRGVDFALEGGEVHALLGENGAGKSTLSKILAGVVAPDSGEIHLHGAPVTMSTPRQAQALGVGMVFQELDLFPHLSVAENLATGNAATAERLLVRPRLLHRWCTPFLHRVGLDVEPRTPLRKLSVGQRQLVAIARALSMSARIILMDEPTSSLSTVNVDALFALLRQLKSDGVSIVYISHKMEEIQRISDRVTVLRDGLRVATERINTVTIDTLIALMVGRSLDPQPRAERTCGDVLLEVQSIQTDCISDIDFQLHAGEVLGVAGLVGSGRSELGAALFGLRDVSSMVATLCNHPFAPTRPEDAIRRGFCLLPEDRRAEGIFPNMATLDNATLAVLDRFRHRGMVNRHLERAAVEPLTSKLKLASEHLDTPIGALSGGNQQKAILARWILADPRVLFLDEPTRGIDVGAKTQIYALIDELVMQGKGIILVSSELPELLHCCDRILVLNEGRKRGIVQARTTSQEEIMRLATIGSCEPTHEPNCHSRRGASLHPNLN